MNYNQFKECVEKRIVERYPKNRYEISIRRVTKNNGMSLDGLCIFEQGVYASPTIYLEPYYEHYKRGAIIADIIDAIDQEYRRGMMMAPDLPSTESYYELIKDHIVMRLINYEKNAELLVDCPYIRIHDLAISFRWLAFQDDIGISSALIRNSELEQWNISKNQLFRDANDNTPRIFPATLTKLSELLESYGEVSYDQIKVDLYVLSNELGINGATSILYQGLLEDTAELLGCSYYLLPSSIHEMMICPKDEQVDQGMLLSLVKEANHMVVTLGDVLSDNIYFYDKDKKILSFIPQSDPIS